MLPVDLFYRQARATPDAVACCHGSRQVTYALLAGQARALASGLQALDPTPGSRVGICCFNHIEHLVAWLAVLSAGKVWVPLYPLNKEAETLRAIEVTGMTIVIADEQSRGLVEASDANVIVANAGGAGTIAHLIETHAGVVPREHFLPLEETQAIKFTGGTTGTPKGVMQPYRAWNTSIATQIRAWNLGPGDRYLAAAPITHGTSTYILPTLGTGGTIVLLDRPRPEETLHCLQHEAITTTFVPPTVIYMMMQRAESRASDYRHLRNLIYGSAPMRSEAIAEAQSIFGPCVASTYGQTEAPQIATMIASQDLARPEKRASVGRETFLTRVGIMRPDGTLADIGDEGEIVIRGDLLMSGYWRQPEKTAQTIVDGWLHTGDLGAFDDEGFLFIKGRARDVIITGGFNVYPIDVELVMAEHPAVADCAIYGVPDEKWGEAVHGAIELREGKVVQGDEIVRFVKDRLGSVKAPKSVTVYERLPRNAYGKLQKQALIERHRNRTIREEEATS